MKLQKALLIFFAAAALLAAAGTTSKVYLGDEVYHHRIAKYFFESGRPVAEPGYRVAPAAGYNVTGATLWYEGLALAWKIFGSVNPSVTQIYHASFYLLLTVMLYLLAKTLGSTDMQAFLAACFAAFCPMVTAFSILLYIDVPACFWMTFTFLLIFKRKFFFAGIAYAAFILTKEYAFLLAPGMLLAIFSSKDETLSRKMRHALMFGGTAFLLILPDIRFRLENFGYAYYAPPQPQYLNPALSYWYAPASLVRDPVGALAYLGAATPLGIAAYLLLEKQKRKDWVLMASSFMYCAFIVFLFRRTLEMRYFMPVVVLLAILAGRGLAQIKHSWLRAVFYGLFLLQFAGTAVYVHSKRQIPQGIEEGFDFLRKKFPEPVGVFYPAESIMDYTGHPVIWVRIPHFQELLWSESPEKVKEALEEGRIQLVVIPEQRIYDDSKVRHSGGYPRSFVERVKANKIPCLVPIFSNSEISIWQVKAAK